MELISQWIKQQIKHSQDAFLAQWAARESHKHSQKQLVNWKIEMKNLPESTQKYQKMETIKAIKRHGKQNKNNKYLIRESEKKYGMQVT